MTGRLIPSWTWRAGRVAALGAFLFVSPASAGDPSRPVLVELFTSQGCSSCPPADAFVGELQSRPEVIALSFNIDYWDYIGWRDTLASHENTLRQQAYARVLTSHQVYTPQMVIDGVVDVPGNQRDKALGLIAAREKQGADQRVPLALKLNGNDIEATIGEGTPREATVIMAYTQRTQTVEIGRGENRGRVVTYHNVVRSFGPVGKWRGESVSLILPIKGPSDEVADGVVVWLQADDMGPILGAGQIRLR